jgi:hypothetical protein
MGYYLIRNNRHLALNKKDSLIVGEMLLRWFKKMEIPPLACVKLLVLSFTTTQLAEFFTS